MIKVRFLEEADLELSKAVDHYEQIYSGLGLDFEREVKENIFKIAENPGIWSLRDDGTRRFSTKRFPYRIVYLLHEDVIWIVAVAHHKRFPEYWKKRLKSELTDSL
jgi:toxin ParE1/3/4